MEAGLDNLLHFPFQFSIDNVRRGLFVIRAVSLSLMIMSQKINVKDGVDLHRWR